MSERNPSGGDVLSTAIETLEARISEEQERRVREVAEARAEGFREAKEEAAKVADQYGDDLVAKGWPKYATHASVIRHRIRAMQDDEDGAPQARCRRPECGHAWHRGRCPENCACMSPWPPIQPLSEDMSAGQDYLALKARCEALELRLAAADLAVGRVAVLEREADALREIAAGAERECEQAERRLAEERARLPSVLEQVRQVFAARGAPTPGGGLAGILAGVEMLADRAERAERAETDNAAWAEFVAALLDINAPGNIHDYCRKMLAKDHPGTTLLAEVEALREVYSVALEMDAGDTCTANFSRLHEALAAVDALGEGKR